MFELYGRSESCFAVRLRSPRPSDTARFTSFAGAFNGPVETIKIRLEHSQGTALWVRNLGDYLLRPLIPFGQLHTAASMHSEIGSAD